MAENYRRGHKFMKEIKELQVQKKMKDIEDERRCMDRKASIHSREHNIFKEKLEAGEEHNLIKSTEAEKMRAAQQEMFALEIDNINKEAFKEIKLRQKLRESSQELRELESKLRAGYVNKELAAQIAEKEATKMSEKLHEMQIHKMMEVQRLTTERKEKEKIQEAYTTKLQYRHELEEQMYQSYHKHQKAYEEFVKEKAVLDKMICIIHEEDQREEELKMLKMRKTKEEIEDFKKDQAFWKEKEKEAIEEEDRRIREFLETKLCEDKSKLEEASKKNQIRLKLQEKLAVAMKEEADKRLEREAIIQELAVEQNTELQDQRIREELEKVIRNRQLLRESYRQQLEERRQKLKEEEQFETAYRKQLLEKFARDERLEQLSAEKQRIKKMQHRRQVQEILEDRHRRRVEEMQKIIALKNLQQHEEKNKRALIEEERIRMLKTHAKNLLGYLPRGVLRKDEFTCLGTEIV